MSWSGNWGRQKAINEAFKFLGSGKTSNTSNAFFSNIDSKKTGCNDSSDCASGWRCSGGYCVQPENSPGSPSGSGGSSNDQGCGGNTSGGDSPSGGGGGVCGATTGASLGGGASGGCVKTGCGGVVGRPGGGGGGSLDCCGAERCCRIDQFGVRCQCGPCPPPEGCDKFCASYSQANGNSAPGCENKGCDECSTCEFYAFQGVKNLYRCEPKESGAPCFCGGESKCEDCEDCKDSGYCQSRGNECYPDPPPRPPSGGGGGGDPCVTTKYRNTICTEPGGPVTSAGTCTAGGGVIVGDSWVSADGFVCVLCEYTDEAGDCDPETCDCNCNDDCPSCQICGSRGVCIPDPRCKEEYFVEYAWINQIKGVTYNEQTSCVGVTNIYNGAKSVFVSNSGSLENDSPSLYWSYTGGPPVNCPSSFCSTAGVTTKDGVVYGQGGASGTYHVESVACRGSEGYEVLFYGTGVIVGYGETPQEAANSAQAQLRS